ncbi:sugar ABC transporter permease [Patescibacteria group bacterium]|nr:sugar ABC transporter permease [Patescibacteria group bacterium]
MRLDLKTKGQKSSFLDGLDRYAKYIFIVPGLIILISLIVYPTIQLVTLSLSEYNLTVQREPLLSGLINYRLLLKDSYFWLALKNTLLLASSAVFIEFTLGLGIALILNQKIKGTKAFKTLFIIPMMIPPVVVGLNFRLIYDIFGPLNFLAETLGIGKINWLGMPLPARLAIIITDVWQWSPFIFIVLFAGLRAVPDYLYDAAKIDGASSLSTFRYVTWPMLIPATVIVLSIRIIDALKLFDIIYMLTYGGPSGSTETLSLYIYRTAFRFGNIGYASACAFVMLAIMSVITFSLIKASRLEKRLEWR